MEEGEGGRGGRDEEDILWVGRGFSGGSEV